MACRFKVTGWLAKKYETPRAAKTHYCEPDKSSVSIENCTSTHKATASASVQTDKVDVSVLTHLFTTLPADDQINVLSKLYSVYMLNNCNIDVPEDFISYASNAMSQLRHSRRTNVLYNLAKGIGTLQEDNSDSRLPTKRMPMGLIEYTASFFANDDLHKVVSNMYM